MSTMLETGDADLEDLSPAELGALSRRPRNLETGANDGEDGERAEDEATVYFRMSGGGHEYVSPTSPHDPEGEQPVYIHRLAARAWDILDSVSFAEDAREVHHHIPAAWIGDDPVPKGGIPWFTAEDHLAAERPDQHAEHHFRGGCE